MLVASFVTERSKFEDTGLLGTFRRPAINTELLHDRRGVSSELELLCLLFWERFQFSVCLKSVVIPKQPLGWRKVEIRGIIMYFLSILV